MNALSWPALVAEALRRRKAERMTQKEHAALADVSIPTIVAFDKGERTLSLNKAFDILRVVGLIEEPVAENAQDVFVRQAFERWQTLTDELPAQSPGRLPYGRYQIDYALGGDLKRIETRELAAELQQAITRATAWPMFRAPSRPGLLRQEPSGIIENWFPLNEDSLDVSFHDVPARYDFWRASSAGQLLFIRGYHEDSQETFSPGVIFDSVLPLWLLGGALLNASRFASLLSEEGAPITVRLRALYTGLTGRTLRSWANPMSGDLFLSSHPSRNDEAHLAITVAANDIERNLAWHVVALAAPLFERFGVTGLSVDGVSAELTRMSQTRLG